MLEMGTAPPTEVGRDRTPDKRAMGQIRKNTWGHKQRSRGGQAGVDTVQSGFLVNTRLRSQQGLHCRACDERTVVAGAPRPPGIFQTLRGSDLSP